MENMLHSVKEFHTAFKLGQKEHPAFISEVDYDMRYKLMKEENEEYLQACKDNNLVEIADALGDKLYVLLGTIISHGMQEIIYPIFEEIHKSNMTKLDVNGEPIYREDGKVTKGSLFKKPDIATIISAENSGSTFARYSQLNLGNHVCKCHINHEWKHE